MNCRRVSDAMGEFSLNIRPPAHGPWPYWLLRRSFSGKDMQRTCRRFRPERQITESQQFFPWVNTSRRQRLESRSNYDRARQRKVL